MKSVVIIFVLLVAVACAGVACQPSLQSGEILCQAAPQDAAVSPGEARDVAFVTSYTAGSCECAVLAAPGADITCCTDETWSPVPSELADACSCRFTAHQEIPAGTFVFYACANIVS